MYSYYIPQLVHAPWLVIFVGRILLYGPLNLKDYFPVRLINLKRYNKYLTNLVFSVRAVSYGSSFFPLDL